MRGKIKILFLPSFPENYDKSVKNSFGQPVFPVPLALTMRAFVQKFFLQMDLDPSSLLPDALRVSVVTGGWQRSSLLQKLGDSRDERIFLPIKSKVSRSAGPLLTWWGNSWSTTLESCAGVLPAFFKSFLLQSHPSFCTHEASAPQCPRLCWPGQGDMNRMKELHGVHHRVGNWVEEKLHFKSLGRSIQGLTL